MTTTFRIEIDFDRINPNEYVNIPQLLRYVANLIDDGDLSIHDDPYVPLTVNGNVVIGKAEFVS